MSETLTTYLHTFLLAMTPVSEIRGSIIYGLATMEQSFQNVAVIYLISVIGNFLPVPFIMLLFRPIMKWLKRTRLFGRFAHWLEKRTHRKANDILKKEAKPMAIALFIFVAIPFPTTGAWTGSMIASLLDIRFRYAFPAILCGILLSGLVMTLLMTGILNLGALGNIFGV